MNFIKEITHFFRVAGNMNISSSEQLLWYALMQLCNSYGWPKQFEATLSSLQYNTGLCQTSVIQARKRLIERGFIKYTSDENTSFYTVISLSEIFSYSDKDNTSIRDKDEEEKPVEATAAKRVENGVENATVHCDTPSYININKNKQNQNTTNSSVLADILEKFTENENLKNAVTNFCQFRQKTRAGFTPESFRLFLRELKTCGNENDMITTVERSLVNGWKCIIPPKNSPPKTSTGFTNFVQRTNYDYSFLENRAFAV